MATAAYVAEANRIGKKHEGYFAAVIVVMSAL